MAVGPRTGRADDRPDAARRIGVRVGVWVGALVVIAALWSALLSADATEAEHVVLSLTVASWILAGALAVSRGYAGGSVWVAGASSAAAATLAALGRAEGWGTDAVLEVIELTTGAVAVGALVVAVAAAADVEPFTGRARPRAVALGGLTAVSVALLVSLTDAGWRPAWIVGVVAVVATLPVVRERFHNASRVGRARSLLLAGAVAMFVATLVVAGTLRVFSGWPARLDLVGGFAGLVVPAATLRGPRMRSPWAMRMARSAIVVSTLAVVVVGVYLLVLVGLGRVPDDSERDLVVRSVIAAGAAAALVVPLRPRVSDVIRRTLARDSDAVDFRELLQARAALGLPLSELLLQAVEGLVGIVGCHQAEIWTTDGASLTRVEAVPARPQAAVRLDEPAAEALARSSVAGRALADVWVPGLLAPEEPDQTTRVVPATYAGELQGVVVAVSDLDALGPEVDELLADVGRQLGLVLANARLDRELQATLDALRRRAEELQQSRARVVTAADAERRRIERDLHDGVQQHLTAMAVNVELARGKIRDDPDAAASMLDELHGDLSQTVTELRHLAHGVYPPALTDRGLEPALREAASRHSTRVTVEVDAGALPKDAEAAVYFCCLEALTNAAKHAPGAPATVRVWRDQGAVILEVVDEGPGFDVASANGGHGLLNMSDRLGAVGGSLRVTSEPGEGTRVRALVPVDG